MDRLDERYRIRGVLGEGSAGIVFDAVRREDGAPVALKVYHYALASAVMQGRFQREVELMRTIEHRRLVHILDWGPYRDSMGLVMERLSGQTLRTSLTQSPVLDTLGHLVDVAEGLAVLHAHGVVHRDIKPENILVRDDAPEAVLLDLGIARPVGGIRLTQPGTSLGTPTYMAPEHAMTNTSSYASDVWAMGVLLYQAVTGRVPFYGRGPLETVSAARRDPPAPMVDVPDPLATLILRCLQKDPERRPAGAAQLLQDLTDVLRQPQVRGTLNGRGPARPTAEGAPTLPEVVGAR